MVEVCCNALIFKNCVSFQELFSQDVLLDLVKENEEEYVFPS
jgi:hypothetical protein